METTKPIIDEPKEKTPILITIANVLVSMNVFYLFIIGNNDFSALYWVGVLIYLVSNILIWNKKAYGVYIMIGLFILVALTAGFYNLFTKYPGAPILSGIYIYYINWFD